MSVYLQINLVPIAVLAIMRFNMHKILSYPWRSRILGMIMSVVGGCIMLRVSSVLLDGCVFPAAASLLWLFYGIYSGMAGFCSLLWFLYVFDYLGNGIEGKHKKVFLVSLPLFFYFFVLLTNPWHRLLYYVDSGNRIAKGAGSALNAVIWFGYPVAASLLALAQSWKESLVELKKEYRKLASFIFLPLIGVFLQASIEGVYVIWPLAVASLLLEYLDIQREQVTRDGLTGLNNRRRLDQYLYMLDNQVQDEKEEWFFILTDINKFKKINDTYGHIVGDEVLRNVAQQVKYVFGSYRSFLARYGGDEFVIVLKCQKSQEAYEAVIKLKEAVREIRWGNKKPWELTISVGYARYDRKTMGSTRDAMALADKRMYRQKRGEQSVPDG